VTGEPEPAVTYHRDIKPILDDRCGGCHSPGNIAPFALTTHAEAAMWAPALVAATAAGTMPPWPPDASCNTYAHDRSLPPEQQQLLAEWAELGAPAGDPADAPATPSSDPGDIVYDLELPLPVAYTPTTAPDEYRCFMLDWPEQAPKYVTAFKATPGEPAIVHHVIAFIIPPAQVAEFAALDAADPGPGYPCFGGPGGERPQWLGSWVPGTTSAALPAGTGVLVEPGSKIVVQMHYHPLAGAAPDRSTLAVRTADSVERRAFVVPFTDPAWVSNTTPMEIPAGAAEVTHGFAVDLVKFLPLALPDSGLMAGDPLVIHAAALHMHTLGVAGSLTVERADGDDDCLLSIPRWDFNWQGSYQLRAPVRLAAGDRLALSCTWNNAAGQETVYWGEGTGDEMCLGVVYVTGE
jgi:hypothetical protein